MALEAAAAISDGCTMDKTHRRRRGWTLLLLLLLARQARFDNEK